MRCGGCAACTDYADVLILLFGRVFLHIATLLRSRVPESARNPEKIPLKRFPATFPHKSCLCHQQASTPLLLSRQQLLRPNPSPIPQPLPLTAPQLLVMLAHSLIHPVSLPLRIQVNETARLPLDRPLMALLLRLPPSPPSQPRRLRQAHLAHPAAQRMRSHVRNAHTASIPPPAFATSRVCCLRPQQQSCKLLMSAPEMISSICTA